MTFRRTLAALGGLALVASGLAAAPAAAAPPVPVSGDQGRGPDRDDDALTGASFAELVRAANAGKAPKVGDGAIDMPTSYPYQPELAVYPAVPDDATNRNNLIAHSELAPRLTELMAQSDRVSTQVVGQSTAGRDLYLVTVTSPESRGETNRQTKWREAIRHDPEAAANDPKIAAEYKTPIWISANIHGNEWEGTDAAMQVIEQLALADDAETAELLDTHRIYFSLSLNPDGRTIATRATTLGLDANRDMITGTTPESRSFVATAQALQPLYAADFHGYTGVLQVEPCGPPHGENYEFDLFIPHAYELALQVEADVVGAGIAGNTYYDTATGRATTENTGNIKIPYRDTPSGWDDYPPVFTAQYAAFHGAVTSTVELPHGRTGTTTTPENAAINTEVARVTMLSMIDYVDAHAADMLANQIEMFRRGAAGEPKDSLTADEVAGVPGPESWKPLWDVADDQDPVELPRAYVIPVGDGQRSESDAEGLVDQLLFHGLELGTLQRDTTVDGVTYPKGSYVVDMHQPLRGLANVLLDLGTDISGKIPSMYDISAWSLSYTWGATVAKVGDVTDPAIGAIADLTRVPQNGVLPKGASYVAFDLAGVEDFRALNAILEAGAPVWMTADGRAIVGPEGLRAAADAVVAHDIAFVRAGAADTAGASPLEDLTIAVAGGQDDVLALGELGFDDLVQVTAAGVNAGSGLDGVDVLWIGSSFSPNAAGRAYVQQWLDAGGALAGRAAGAFNAAASFGLVSGRAVNGNGSGNGIVSVDTPEGSILGAHPQASSFIYPATWFTDLGAGTTAELTYDAEQPFLAGHWRASGAGTNGPANAAGQPAVVSGESASGAKAVIFGTSPFFRTHPKGGMSQVATALFWVTAD